MNEQGIGYWLIILAGPTIGLAGGALGVFFAIRNAKTQAEKKLIKFASMAVFLGVLSFCLLLWCVPPPWNQFLWVPYVCLLVLSIKKINRLLIGIQRS